MSGAVSVSAGFACTAGCPSSLVPGFNLLGNGVTAPLDVIATFGTGEAPAAGVSANVDSIWAWNAVAKKWLFHSPQLPLAQSQSYAAANNYQALAAVPAGGGFWVNALAPFDLVPPAGAPFNYGPENFVALPSSFNLIAIGGVMTPLQFNNAVSPTLPATVANSFNALWAWDAARSKWYFYSPSLESAAIPAPPFSNAQYGAAHGLLDFGGGTPPAPIFNLQPGVGFWVDKF
jgi:hypothetical protein